MAKLIVIAGNNASGKTTLTRALCEAGGFNASLESHEDRPYQPLFAQDQRRYALPNQIDYLLRRAEQEVEIRAGDVPGVQDGGLDQDYHLYTHLFHHKGFLDEREFALLQRAYRTLRAGLPKPDLIVRLKAPLAQLRQRLQARARLIDLEAIVTLDDLPFLEERLDEWLGAVPPADLLVVDVAGEDAHFSGVVGRILEKI